jgi:hypothetical protein
LASLANTQISPSLPNPIMAPNPLTTTISIFRSNMQDKIMKAGRDARVQVQLPADEGRSLVCRAPRSCGGYILHHCCPANEDFTDDKCFSR